MLGQSNLGRVLAQQPRTKPVKCAEPDRLPRHQSLDAAAHFVGGFVGEGERDDLARKHALVQQMSDSVRDDPSFSAARPGNNK